MTTVQLSEKPISRKMRPIHKSVGSSTRKLSGGAIARSVLGRVLSPGHLLQAAQLHRARKANRRKFDDAQLALYAQILPSDFLHYGYFDDTQRKPEDISLSDITCAQRRYADLVLDLAGDPAYPVLDVGCGMGGLSRMLCERGFTPTALTPDRLQVSHLKTTQPRVPVIHSKFEQLPIAENAGKFGTVFTAESLQYLKLDQALPVMAGVLRPEGKWVACDYFKAKPSPDRSCHDWDEFRERVTRAGWRVSYERDITAHVLPTLSYLHMWAVRLGIPLMHFAALRLRRKQPGLHHLLNDTLKLMENFVQENIGVIDPKQFVLNRRYMLLAMQRQDAR